MEQLTNSDNFLVCFLKEVEILGIGVFCAQVWHL